MHKDNSNVVAVCTTVFISEMVRLFHCNAIKNVLLMK